MQGTIACFQLAHIKVNCTNRLISRNTQVNRIGESQSLNYMAHVRGGGSVRKSEQPLNANDPVQYYESACSTAPVGTKVIAQNVQRVRLFDDLFYAQVSVNNRFQLRGMLDSGSMACTLSEEAELQMKSEDVLPEPKPLIEEIVLVGCGGKHAIPNACTKLN